VGVVWVLKDELGIQPEDAVAEASQLAIRARAVVEEGSIRFVEVDDETPCRRRTVPESASIRRRRPNG